MGSSTYFAMVATLALAAGCGRTPEPIADTAAASTPLKESRPARGQLQTQGPIVAAQGCEHHPGPTMVEVTTPAGSTYCIDATEVTQEQYALFLKSAAIAPGTEHARCEYNRSYVPELMPRGPLEPSDCPSELWTPDSTPDRPVVCVDWCDAYAYCAWAGKRLCRSSGASNLEGAVNDADSSEWFNACSAGGKHSYPYGYTYDSTACVGADSTNIDKAATPTGALGPASSHPRCAGANRPFSSIVDLSGSVREWTDECVWEATPNGGDWWCGIRGGDYLSSAEDLACATKARRNIGAKSVHFGFRCCRDAPDLGDDGVAK